MNLFFVVFCLFVLLPNSMSKLINNRCTCKLVIKRDYGCIRAAVFSCFSLLFCSP